MAVEDDARRLIEALDLSPHPEGGWYRETWRGEAMVGERATGTAILFLLEPHQRSHWHKIDAEEHWFWHAGGPLALSIAAEGQATQTALLGGDVLGGQTPQLRVPAHHWQAAVPLYGWTLVSCTVIPGFDFAGFTLVPLDWSPA